MLVVNTVLQNIRLYGDNSLEAGIKLQTLNIIKHRDHEKKQLEQRRVAEHTTWLQEEYASLLFEECRAHYKGLGSTCRQDFAMRSTNLKHTGRFNECILVQCSLAAGHISLQRVWQDARYQQQRSLEVCAVQPQVLQSHRGSSQGLAELQIWPRTRYAQ